jgi:hypothetical protein
MENGSGKGAQGRSHVDETLRIKNYINKLPRCMVPTVESSANLGF